MNERKHVHIGASGWHYDHWGSAFYPQKLPKDRRLAHYARFFDTVEINNSFYRLPEKRTLKKWAETAPEGFIFAVKASRYITHMKKLKDPEASAAKFLERLPALGDKVGPILFQLPPRWRVNLERLQAFLQILPEEYEYAFEFRDPTWFNKDTYNLLTEHNAALCIYDMGGETSPKKATADHMYIRLHGPDGPYEGRYPKNKLAGWAGAISSWSAAGRRVYCYFDNDQHGYAPRNARELRDMLLV